MITLEISPASNNIQIIFDYTASWMHFNRAKNILQVLSSGMKITKSLFCTHWGSKSPFSCNDHSITTTAGITASSVSCSSISTTYFQTTNKLVFTVGKRLSVLKTVLVALPQRVQKWFFTEGFHRSFFLSHLFSRLFVFWLFENCSTTRVLELRPFSHPCCPEDYAAVHVQEMG